MIRNSYSADRARSHVRIGTRPGQPVCYTPRTKVADGGVMSKAQRKVVDRIIEELFNQHRLDIIEELYTDDVEIASPGGLEGAGGCEAIRAAVIHYRETFPDHRYVLEQVVCDGDTVAIRWTVNGSRKSDADGRKASDKPYEVEGMAFCHFRDGKIESDLAAGRSREARPSALRRIAENCLKAPPISIASATGARGVTPLNGNE